MSVMPVHKASGLPYWRVNQALIGLVPNWKKWQSAKSMAEIIIVIDNIFQYSPKSNIRLLTKTANRGYKNIQPLPYDKEYSL